jgi:hypothetical protein
MFRRSRHGSYISVACHCYVFGSSACPSLIEYRESAAAALNELALKEADLGDLSSALAHQRSAALLSPLNPSIIWNLVEFLRKSHDPNLLQQALNECLIARELCETSWKTLKQQILRIKQRNQENKEENHKLSYDTLAEFDREAAVFPWLSSWNFCICEILMELKLFKAALNFGLEAQRVDRKARIQLNQPEQLFDLHRKNLNNLVETLEMLTEKTNQKEENEEEKQENTKENKWKMRKSLEKKRRKRKFSKINLYGNKSEKEEESQSEFAEDSDNSMFDHLSQSKEEFPWSTSQ